MILSEKIAKYSVSKLASYGYIEKEHIPYFVYILDWVMDYVFYITSLLLVGVVIKRFLPSLCFCITITLLRCISGGTHAPSRLVCSILSYGNYLLVLLLSSQIPEESIVYLLPVFLISLLCISLLSPIDVPQKRLNKKQKVTLHIYALFSCFTLCSFLIMFFFFHHLEYCFIIGFCAMISAIDLTIGFIRNRKEKRHVS